MVLNLSDDDARTGKYANWITSEYGHLCSRRCYTVFPALAFTQRCLVSLERSSDGVPASKNYPESMTDHSTTVNTTPDDATSKVDQQDKVVTRDSEAARTTTTTVVLLEGWAEAALASGSWTDALIAAIDVSISLYSVPLVDVSFCRREV